MATGYWTEGKVVNGTNVGGGTFVATPTQSAANASQPGTYSTGFSSGGGYSYTPSQAPSNVRSIDTVIPATDLTKLETPLPIVPKPVLDNPFADITSSNNLLGVTTATDGMSPKVGNTQFGQDMTNAADLIGKAIGQKPNAEEIYLRREREAGIQQKQQTVNTYQTQLNQIVADAQAKQLSVVGQGRGIPEAIIGGQQAQISREAAIQALPVQALLSAAQGDLTFAQNRLDKLAQLAIEDANATYEQKKDMFTFAYNYASDQQKTRLAQAEKAADRQWEMEKLNIQDRSDWAKTALTIGNTDAFKTIMASDPKSANYTTQISNAISSLGNTGTVDSQYQPILDTILGSGKFTKEQVNLVKAAILRGDDPLTVIKNQAKNMMTATNAGDLQKYEVARDTLSDIGSQLQEFYAKGGDTGLISGNFEKVINKLGKVSDPNLVTLATQIQGNLQVYRNAISGTAYSEQEGKDIATIFPGINKSSSLNSAILKGRSLLFDSVIDSNYRSVLGSTYDTLKKIDTKPTNEVSVTSEVDPAKQPVGSTFQYNGYTVKKTADDVYDIVDATTNTATTAEKPWWSKLFGINTWGM
jgi:hypothetical protein